MVNVFVLQAEQFGSECFSWKFLNAIFQMIRRLSAIMWEFHMTLWPSLARALEAGHPKDLERHVDPTMHEVLMDNSHRPPYLLACRRIEFIKKYTQLAQTSRAGELKLRLNMPARHPPRIFVHSAAGDGCVTTYIAYSTPTLLLDLRTGMRIDATTGHTDRSGCYNR